MRLHVIHMMLIAAIPLTVLFIEWFDDGGIIERHHSHHDTYLVPRAVSTSLMLMMIFVGALGLVVVWLSGVGIFHTDEHVIAAFFASFLMVSLVAWLGIRRYRVVTFDDRLEVREIFGSPRTFAYNDITEIKRLHRRFNNYYNLRVYAGKQSVLLWGLLDLDQIIDRIDRPDLIVEF